MIKKGFIFAGIFLILVLGVVTLISAPNNDSNNTNNNQTNNNQTNGACTEDDDCPTGKECEDGTCVIDDEDEEENETEDDDQKVCCKSTETNEDNKTKIEYEYEDSKDCVLDGGDEVKEVVNNSLCNNEDDENESIKVCCRFSLVQEKKGEALEKTKYIWVDSKDCDGINEDDDELISKVIINDTSLCQEKYRIREKQRLHFENKTKIDCPDNCTCTGVVMKCPLEDGGQQMTIFAGKSGNIIIQIKGVNITTNVTIYNENGTLIGEFENGNIKIIKVFPEQVREKIKERVKAKISDEEIELKDDGYYEYKVKKQARFLGMFKVKEKVTTEVDPETGEVIKTKTSWWGFLANDSEEEED